MAVYKLNSQKQKTEKKRNTKKIVGYSLIGSASVIFLLMTGVIKPLQIFFLGLLGVFGYPLCVILLIVGLALLNNRRYVMSIRYTVCLILDCRAYAFFYGISLFNNNNIKVWILIHKTISRIKTGRTCSDYYNVIIFFHLIVLKSYSTFLL